MIRRARVGAAGNQTVMLCGLNAPAAGLGDGVTVAPSGMPGGHSFLSAPFGSAFWHPPNVKNKIARRRRAVRFYHDSRGPSKPAPSRLKGPRPGSRGSLPSCPPRVTG
eukprot:scaffold1991_cov111-Isochrysis_galbana.AAC.3